MPLYDLSTLSPSELADWQNNAANTLGNVTTHNPGYSATAATTTFDTILGYINTGVGIWGNIVKAQNGTGGTSPTPTSGGGVPPIVIQQPPAPTSNNTVLFVGLGVGLLVVIVFLAVAFKK
jgi:hypothetical protein